MSYKDVGEALMAAAADLQQLVECVRHFSDWWRLTVTRLTRVQGLMDRILDSDNVAKDPHLVSACDQWKTLYDKYRDYNEKVIPLSSALSCGLENIFRSTGLKVAILRWYAPTTLPI